MKMGDIVTTSKGHGIVSEEGEEFVVITISEGAHAGESIRINVVSPLKKKVKSKHTRAPSKRKHHIDPRLLTPVALGLMAFRGKLDALVPVENQQTFDVAYAPYMDEGQLALTHVAKIASNKWGNELRVIVFATKPELEEAGVADFFKLDDHQSTIPNPNRWRISHTSLWWQLVEKGFRLGTGHDIEAILADIGTDHQQEFEKFQIRHKAA